MSVTNIRAASVVSGGSKGYSLRGGLFVPQNIADQLLAGRTRPNLNIVAGGYNPTVTTLWYEISGIGGTANLTTGSWDWSASVYIPPLRQVLRIGGSGANQTYMYDFATNAWTAKAAQPITNMNFTSAAWDDVTRKVYVIGDNTAGNQFFYSYDPFANTWSAALTQTGMTVRAQGSLVAWNGKLLYFGGYTSSTAYDTLYIYDTVAGTWSTGTQGSTANGGPGPRYGHHGGIMQAGPYAGQMAVLGGVTVYNTGLAADTKPYFYNPVTNTWSSPSAYTFPTNWAMSNRSSIQVYLPFSCTVGQFICTWGGNIPGSSNTYEAWVFDTINGYAYNFATALSGFGIRNMAVFAGVAWGGQSTLGYYFTLKGGVVANAITAMALPTYGA